MVADDTTAHESSAGTLYRRRGNGYSGSVTGFQQKTQTDVCNNSKTSSFSTR
jgi:hypothetical protein